MFVCVCVFVWSQKHGGSSSVSRRGERGERVRLQIDGGERGKERRKETGREMELRTVPAALH